MNYSSQFRTTLAPGQWSARWSWPIDPALQANTWPLCPAASTDNVTSLIRGGSMGIKPVDAPPQRGVKLVMPSMLDDSPQIQRALDGNYDVMAVGRFTIASTIKLPAFSRIFSAPGAASFICLAGSASTTMFQPGSYSTLDGLTLFPLGQAVLNTQAVNFTMKSCTLYQGAMGVVGVGALFQDNLFSRCNVQITSKTLHWRDTFIGIGNNGPSTFSSGMDNSAFVDCLWDRTDRGPVNQVGHSSITNCAWIRCIVRDVCQTDGGSEWFLVEGSADDPGNFSNNLIWGMRTRGCVGWMQYSCCTARNNLIHDLETDKGGTILYLANGPGAEQSGNVIELAELYGGTIGWKGNAHDNLIQKSAIINPMVGRSGTFSWPLDQIDQRYGFCYVFTGAPSNKASSIRIRMHIDPTAPLDPSKSDQISYVGGVTLNDVKAM